MGMIQDEKGRYHDSETGEYVDFSGFGHTGYSLRDYTAKSGKVKEYVSDTEMFEMKDDEIKEFQTQQSTKIAEDLNKEEKARDKQKKVAKAVKTKKKEPNKEYKIGQSLTANDGNTYKIDSIGHIYGELYYISMVNGNLVYINKSGDIKLL